MFSQGTQNRTPSNLGIAPIWLQNYSPCFPQCSVQSTVRCSSYHWLYWTLKAGAIVALFKSIIQMHCLFGNKSFLVQLVKKTSNDEVKKKGFGEINMDLGSAND